MMKTQMAETPTQFWYSCCFIGKTVTKLTAKHTKLLVITMFKSSTLR